MNIFCDWCNKFIPKTDSDKVCYKGIFYHHKCWQRKEIGERLAEQESQEQLAFEAATLQLKLPFGDYG